MSLPELNQLGVVTNGVADILSPNDIETPYKAPPITCLEFWTPEEPEECAAHLEVLRRCISGFDPGDSQHTDFFDAHAHRIRQGIKDETIKVPDFLFIFFERDFHMTFPNGKD